MVRTDCLELTQDEALELMTHHLRMAALFFEATSDDTSGNRAEMVRLIGDGIHLEASKFWFDMLNDSYEKLKLDD